MKDAQMELVYKQAETSRNEVQRRVEAAFDVLFESIWSVELETLPHPPLLQYLDVPNVSASLEEVRS